MPQKNRNIAIIAASVGIMVVIFYAYWSLIYSPNNQKMEQKRREVDKLRAEVQQAEARASQLDKIRAEMAGLQVDVAQLEKQLPKNRELPSLLRVVTHRAEAFGVNLLNFQPQKAVSKGLYDEIAYNITATASFHGIGRFLTAMGKGERLFAARNLVLTGASNKTDPTKTVNATFQLISFKYHE
jgi:type IV pilus assembly protein PilO